MEAFDLALNELRSCGCNNETEKDGCYRCLYAYRSSYKMPETSRDTAIELLSEILRHKDAMIKTDTLRNVRMNVLFDSELEARFIEALRRMRTGDLPIALNKELVNGKPGYFLRIGDRAYHIEPQVNLGPAEGVSIPVRADFIFRSHERRKALSQLQSSRMGFSTTATESVSTWLNAWLLPEAAATSHGHYMEGCGEPIQV